MGSSASGRAALFDMDGTLVDSTTVVELLWRGFADEHGLDPPEVLAFAHGRQSRDTVARFVPHLDADELAAGHLANELRVVEGIEEVPGAASFIAAVAAVVPVAVVTSAPRALAELRLGLAGIAPPEVLIAGEDVTGGKPDPEGYLLGARQLGVDIAQCVAFEDADAGLAAARASGATTVVVGDHAGPAASGLLRLADLRRARVSGKDGIVTVTAG